VGKAPEGREIWGAGDEFQGQNCEGQKEGREEKIGKEGYGSYCCPR